MHTPTENEFSKLSWHWVSGGSSFIEGRSMWRDLHEARFPVSWYADPASSPIPGFAQTVERITKTGFGYVRASSSLVFTKSILRDDGSATYGACGWLHFTKDDLMFRQQVASAPSTDVASALASIRFEHDGIALISSVLVEGGQGQLDRARKHAADMLRRAGDASLYLDSCEVECRTRGGRGGWRDKTLTKRFSVKEIAMLMGNNK